MSKFYNEIVFKDNASPDINASNLNRISHALAQVDERVDKLGVFEEEARESAEQAKADAESAKTSAEKAMSGTPEGYAQLVEDVKKKITTQYVANVNVDTLKAGLYWVNGYGENVGSVPYTNTHYTIAGIGRDGADGQCTDQIAVHHNGQSAKVRHRDFVSRVWGEWQTIGKETRKMLTDEWQSKGYNAGVLVIWNNALKKCKLTHSTAIEPSNTTYWEDTTIANELKKVLTWETYTGTTLGGTWQTGQSLLELPAGKNYVSVIPNGTRTNGLMIHGMYRNDWGTDYVILTDWAGNPINNTEVSIKYLAY